MLFQQEHIDRYELTDGTDGHEWLPGVYTLILTTIGRNSGLERQFAVIYRSVGDNYVLVGSRGGADTHPNWYLNLVAHPGVVIQVGAQRIRARARTAEGAERQWLWPLMVETFPTFDDYQANTTRNLPIVVLEPIHDPSVSETEEARS
jgi:deazaflavin-dependent oxidoreductase (nitroreductase family)